jgi:4-aminobutyrate aminotransferase/(S)-3-amino-2-methylpropionate transaminase
MKIARQATGRQAFVSFVGAFHGRTMMTLALTGKVAPYKTGFGPFPADVYHVPFPIDYHGISEEDSLKALDALFKADVDPKRIAAIIIEPVQGEGGFYIASAGFLRRLREICDEHGILLVADEVQTGFGRTGKLFAIEHSGVVPDLICMAKSLAGGFPLSAVCGRADIMDSVAPGGLGGTYAGSPVSCAAGLGVMDAIEEENLLERSLELGRHLRKRLEAMAKSNAFPFIGEIRGLGGMVAVELVKDRDTHEPAPELTTAIVKKAAEKGLILLSCGVRGNVIRFLMPLTASNDLVDEGLDILEAAFGEAAEAA